MTNKHSKPRLIAGYSGIMMATPFFAWALLGGLDFIPSLVDVFGVPGLRIPASITIAGLIISAIAFYEE